MLTWLKANTRRAARPARPAAQKPVVAPAPIPVEDELPPPFFADEDPAFLDMGEVATPPAAQTPPPLPITAISQPADMRLANALAALPPWPAVDSPTRTEQLLTIFRALDRIAGDVCEALEKEPGAS